MVLKAETRRDGEVVVTTLPAEVARRLAGKPGQELYWREARLGAYTVPALDPTQAEALRVMEEVIERYRPVLAALAE